MKLIINNLGVIKEAIIDINKQFNLFCGRNSTGKTYTAYLLAAFLDEKQHFDLNCLNELTRNAKESGFFCVEKSHITDWLTQNCNDVKKNIGGIFGISDDVCKKLFGDLLLNVDYSDEDYQNFFKTALDYSLKNGSTSVQVKKKELSSEVYITPLSKEQMTDYFWTSLVCFIIQKSAFSGRNDVRMLTVERNSIYTFKTELSISRNELIDRIQQQTSKEEIDVIGMLNSSSRRYPKSIRESLRVANDLENVQKYTSSFADVAVMIEKNLLMGDVGISKNGDVEFHSVNMKKGRKLPFHLSSSIVKTMASFVIWLRHIAKEGDTLIIDEPEMNFHPDVQVVLTRIFALLSNRGIYVIISSHSDYVAREMNALIMAAELKKRNINTSCVDDNFLYKENVGVFYFTSYRKKYVKAKQIEIDEYGFSIDSIDSAINEQNNRLEELYDALKESEISEKK